MAVARLSRQRTEKLVKQQKLTQIAESFLRPQMKDAIKVTDSSQRSSLHRKVKLKSDAFIVLI